MKFLIKLQSVEFRGTDAVLKGHDFYLNPNHILHVKEKGDRRGGMYTEITLGNDDLVYCIESPEQIDKLVRF